MIGWRWLFFFYVWARTEILSFWEIIFYLCCACLLPCVHLQTLRKLNARMRFSNLIRAGQFLSSLTENHPLSLSIHGSLSTAFYNVKLDCRSPICFLRFDYVHKNRCINWKQNQFRWVTSSTYFAFRRLLRCASIITRGHINFLKKGVQKFNSRKVFPITFCSRNR